MLIRPDCRTTFQNDQWMGQSLEAAGIASRAKVAAEDVGRAELLAQISCIRPLVNNNTRNKKRM